MTPRPDLDARGQRCPLPVIALARLAARHEDGDVLVVWADDPAARTDIPAWARLRGHQVTVRDDGRHTVYDVTVGGVTAT